MISPIQLIKDWYNLYTPIEFVGHKIVHVGIGALIGAFCHAVPLIGMAIVLVAAVFKEVMDRKDSYDPTAEKEGANPYRYDAPLSAHVLDVIVTLLGGVLGIIPFYLL